ncbi:MAG TPA: tRNA (cytidine(34)-2'-O)-methyltransferase [Hellea balneolensis]|uniref:tRNA (cytidine(34)-2'-O)-methyltransferase n=1 Tax=Hellea balneolensis TaxID=287478 RepID=A0A7C5QVU3_9PROT|nr:tRNA (cytidine(34)-2'-O)-methyltransferase [Hellea balneolensis]
MKLVLYQPDIAQNLGAALRLCACFGVKLEIIEPCGFPLTAKAIRRVAMDYGVPEALTRHKSWPAFKNHESNHQRRIVLMTTKAAKPITEFAFEPTDILLFGRESAGVPQQVHSDAQARVYIPITQNARSLNLVSSASITLFEALRQTGTCP